MLRKDIDEFLKSLPKDVTLVAATKYVDANIMKEMLSHGINNFGENRVDAFLTKYEELSDKNIIWHFIGHLQRNKAKQIINKIDYLHSLDSIELAKIINKERVTPLNCFVEISVNGEESKNGVPLNEALSFIKELLTYKKIKVVGLMMMAINDTSHDSLIKQFKTLDNLKNNIEKELNINIPYLSMGMSNDYKEAIECGATHIRLGRILFENM